MQAWRRPPREADPPAGRHGHRRASEGARVTVRRMHDLHLLHSYAEEQADGSGAAAAGGAAAAASAASRVSALSLCAENHHAFVASEDGALRILANPMVNLQVMEQIASELLNL